VIPDVQASNILIHTGESSEPDEPVIEGEVEILGQKYTALLVPQPLPNFWRWDDDRMMAERYNVTLNDLGTGDLDDHCPEALSSNIFRSDSQRNGWAKRRTIELPLHTLFELLKSFCRPGMTPRSMCGQLDAWCVTKPIFNLREPISFAGI